MYEASVEATFSACHRVRMPGGEFEPLNGHDWRVEVVFRAAELDLLGMVIDFVAAKRALKRITRRLHHTDLNTSPVLTGRNPTAENVAKAVYTLLSQNAALQPTLHRVRVTEAPGCTATYTSSGD